MACHEFDAQVARPNRSLQALEEKFVRLRIVNMAEVDIARFQFDFSNTFAAFVLNHEGSIYCRYGARDDESAESFVSEPSFARALQQGLAMHERWKAGTLEIAPPPEPKAATSYPKIRQIVNKGECVHCHQIAAAQADEAMAGRDFDKLSDVWIYPDPARLGLLFDPDGGNVLAGVGPPASTSTRLRAGAAIIGVGGERTTTYADIRHVLHGLEEGVDSLEFRSQDGVAHSVPLGEHWRVTDISRRPIHHKMRPFPGFWGRALSAERRADLRLPEDGLATEVTKFWRQTNGSRAGLREGDIVVAIDGVRQDPLAINAMVHTRLHHGTGDRIEVTYLRGGQERTATFQLRATPW